MSGNSRKDRMTRFVGGGEEADAAYEKALSEASIFNRRMSRRGFVKLVSAAAVATAAGVALGGCNASEVITGEKTVTDDWGREVTIPAPDTIERVYFTSQLAEIFVYTLNPDLIAGVTSGYTQEQLEYLPDRIADLPELGAINAGGTVDYETLLQLDVQVVFSISGVALTQGNLSDAEKMTDQTGIPVVMIDGSFDKIAHAYRFLGECIGEESRAEEVGSYCETKHKEVVDALSSLKDEDKISLYYAEGPEGLYTEPDESQHSLCFQIAGAKNVAEVPLGGNLGMSPVNLEQVLEWNPEVIIAWDTEMGGAYDDILSNSDWASIDAVKNDNVYCMPWLPFSWCDRPPGINRLIGIQWVANLLYPDLYDVDMVEVTKDFYKNMYQTDITDDEAKQFLGTSYPPKGIRS
ncbi:MAG: ABC transporter substrate-binding protein [Coriobacteriales bacterium]|jgi:iron complex transport system substrate-binding protein